MNETALLVIQMFMICFLILEDVSPVMLDLIHSYVSGEEMYEVLQTEKVS